MYLSIKRLLDILAATLALMLLSPLFIPIIIALRLTGEGEVFYRQNRVGFRKQYFQIWKFATMLKNSPNMGTGSLTLRNDPRVTLIGKVPAQKQNQRIAAVAQFAHWRHVAGRSAPANAGGL